MHQTKSAASVAKIGFMAAIPECLLGAQPRRIARPRPWSYLGRRRLQVLLLILISLYGARSADAQSTFVPYVSTDYNHNNNVFALPNSQAAYEANGDPRLGDSSLRTTAGAEESYYWGRQRLYATVEGSYINYDQFTYLNHFENTVKLGLDWKLLTMFDGTFGASEQRYMAPFANRNTETTLAVNIDRNISAKFNTLVSPEWRLVTHVVYDDLDSPIQDYPDYGLTQTTGGLALQYLGVANLTYGIATEYAEGRYLNAPIQGTYNQTSVDLTMTYAITHLSSFTGAVGYTEREQGQNQGNVSAVTGALGYTRALTGKTSLSLNYTRSVNSYVAAGGSELDSTVALRVNYQPRFKLGISASVQEMWSDFLGQTIPGSDTEGRRDRTPEVDIKITYDVRKWLLIQPYATYQKRNSNVEYDGFTSTVIGLKIQAKMQPPPMAAR
jgi:Putative beta-barrel porin 2